MSILGVLGSNYDLDSADERKVRAATTIITDDNGLDACGVQSSLREIRLELVVVSPHNDQGIVSI